MKSKILESIRLLLEEISRSTIIGTIKNDKLKGAYGEYLCSVIALKINKPDSWHSEVKRLLNEIDEYLTSDKNYNKKLIQQSIELVKSDLKSKLAFAKTKVTNYYPDKSNQISKLKIDANQEFLNMIKKFKPEFLEYV